MYINTTLVIRNTDIPTSRDKKGDNMKVKDLIKQLEKCNQEKEITILIPGETIQDCHVAIEINEKVCLTVIGYRNDWSKSEINLFKLIEEAENNY